MIIGIDPGLSGAWAAITDCGDRIIDSGELPRVADLIDCYVLSGIFRSCEKEDHKHYDPAPHRARIEKVGPMPKQGIASTAKFMRAYGQVIGAVQAMPYFLELVTPQAWKKAVLVGLNWKGNKEIALQYVINRYPNFERGTNKAKALARAEAVCIALSALKG